MFLRQGIEMVLGTIEQNDAALTPILVLRVQNLCKIGQVEPHDLHVRVGLDETMVGAPIVVNSRNQGDPRLDLHLWRGVGSALLLPFSAEEVRLSDPDFIDVDDSGPLLEKLNHFLGVFVPQN